MMLPTAHYILKHIASVHGDTYQHTLVASHSMLNFLNTFSLLSRGCDSFSDIWRKFYFRPVRRELLRLKPWNQRSITCNLLNWRRGNDRMSFVLTSNPWAWTGIPYAGVPGSLHALLVGSTNRCSHLLEELIQIDG